MILTILGSVLTAVALSVILTIVKFLQFHHGNLTWASPLTFGEFDKWNEMPLWKKFPRFVWLYIIGDVR